MLNTTFLAPRNYEELTHQAKRILQCKRLLSAEKRGYTLPEMEAIIQIGQTIGLSPWQSAQSILIIRGQASV